MKKVIPAPTHTTSIASLAETHDNLLCRFCHSVAYSEDPADSTIFPCECIVPIHLSCLNQEMEVVKRGMLIEPKKEKSYHCQGCKKMIQFLSESRLECRSCAELAQYVSKRKSLCIWLVIGTVLMLFLVTAVLLLHRWGVSIGDSPSKSSIIICLLIVITLLLFVITFYFLEVLVKRKHKVRLIKGNSDVTTKRRKESNIEIIDCQ